MRRNNRCELVYFKKSDGFLEDTSIFDKSVVVSCSIKAVSYTEQVNLFGKYNPEAMKIHIQGLRRAFRYVRISGVDYTPASIRYFKNSTVVIIT